MQTPDGTVIAVDTGSQDDIAAMLASLNRLNVKRIDLLLVTSHRYTALGAVPALIHDGIAIRSVWQTRDPYNGRAYRAAMATFQQSNTGIREVNANDSIQVGSKPFSLVVLWPPEHGLRSGDPLTCRVDYGNTVFLLHGAATGASEQAILGSYGQKLSSEGQYCILQTAYHGASSATTPELLRWSTPEAAIIPCIAAAPPDPITLHRLAAAGASIWRTDTEGTITVTADGTTAPEISATTP
jgi:competence protein ComEC